MRGHFRANAGGDRAAIGGNPAKRRGMALAPPPDMDDRPVVLCAVDLGSLTPRLLLHAAGMARLMSAELRVVHVAGDASSAQHERVMTECLRHVPYEVALEPEQVVVRTGRVSDAIHREARRRRTVLVVIGSHGRRGLARLLGSTSAAVLKGAAVPVLIVPPGDVDIISVGDRMRLSCGPVLAAVDLAVPSEEQLQIAGEMAVLAGQPLMMLTVARSRTTDHAASSELRDRAHLMPIKPHAMIVRRGAVATAVADCARTEGAGLVVMGISRGRPGAIAAALMRTGRAFVLAVPATPVRLPEPAPLARAMAPLASLMLALALTTGSAAAQVRFSDTEAIVHFQRTVDSYAFLHRQVERRLGLVHHEAPGSDAMAIAMREARPGATPGELLTPDVVPVIRLVLARAARAAGCAPPAMSGTTARVHDRARDAGPLAPCLADALPRLPAELEFRWSGDALVLVDTHADLVVDLISGLFAATVF